MPVSIMWHPKKFAFNLLTNAVLCVEGNRHCRVVGSKKGLVSWVNNHNDDGVGDDDGGKWPLDRKEGTVEI